MSSVVTEGTKAKPNNRLARRARSFKEDLLEKLNNMKTPHVIRSHSPGQWTTRCGGGCDGPTAQVSGRRGVEGAVAVPQPRSVDDAVWRGGGELCRSHSPGQRTARGGGAVAVPQSIVQADRVRGGAVALSPLSRLLGPEAAVAVFIQFHGERRLQLPYRPVQTSVLGWSEDGVCVSVPYRPVQTSVLGWSEDGVCVSVPYRPVQGYTDTYAVL